MPPNDRTLYTFWGRYRTEAAVNRAECADIIPLPSTNSVIYAVHPIPAAWLRVELLPRERDDVREHIALLLSGTRSLVPAFVEALQVTFENLNPGRNGRNMPTPGSSSRGDCERDIDEVTGQFGNLDIERRHRDAPPSSRSIRFAEEEEDRVTSLPSPSLRSSRCLPRSYSHSRTKSSSATTGFNPVPERDVHETLQDSGHRDELAALELHLTEVDQVMQNGIHVPDVLNRHNDSVREARADLNQIRTLRQLTSNDVDLAHAIVNSVAESANQQSTLSASTGHRRHRQLISSSPRPIVTHEHTGSFEREGSTADPRGRPHRSGHQHTTSDTLGSLQQHLELAAIQEQQRRISYVSDQFPVWRSPPVAAQPGDGLASSNGRIRRLSLFGEWLDYHGKLNPYM